MQITIGLDPKSHRKLIKSLERLGKKTAGDILRTEFRGVVKEAAAVTKPLIPKDTGVARRTLTVRKLKTKKRGFIGFRLFMRYPPDDKKFYQFAPNFGRKKYAPFPGTHFMEAGRMTAVELFPHAVARIKRRISQAWKARRV